MNEISIQNAMAVEAVPRYLERYAAEVERWHQESVTARTKRAG